MKTLAILVALTLVSCSPYRAELEMLEEEYAAGLIQSDYYYAQRSQLLHNERIWKQERNARLGAAALAAQAQTNTSNAINAYNYRTNVLAQPQRVNVHHSGTINHTINGPLIQPMGSTQYLY